MNNEKQPGLTLSIPEIMDTIKRKYSEWHELVIAGVGAGNAWIQDGNDVLEIEFDSLNDLYKWTLRTQAELDEQETEQLKENARINYESAKKV